MRMEPVVKLSKSDEMRKLYDEGKTIAEIARIMNTYYSFVHRVIQRHKEPPRPQVLSKSEQIRKLFDEGKKVDEIAKELKLDRSFVYGVVKRHKQALRMQVPQTNTEEE